MKNRHLKSYLSKKKNRRVNLFYQNILLIIKFEQITLQRKLFAT
jgi:hypothetical protein